MLIIQSLRPYSSLLLVAIILLALILIGLHWSFPTRLLAMTFFTLAFVVGVLGYWIFDNATGHS